MEIFVGAIFLSVILGLLNQKVQGYLKKWLCRCPGHIFLVSWVLGMLICFVAAQGGGSARWDMRHLIYGAFAYTFIPAFLFYNSGYWHPDNRIRADSWIEFGVMLMLWVPIEITMSVNSGRWLRSFLQGSTHILAYGVAVTLGLAFFLLFKQLKGIKYNFSLDRIDLGLIFAGFMIAGAVLIPLGLWLKFIQPLHMPANFYLFGFFKLFAGTFLGVALPEEILFRGLLQNWLMQKFGGSNKTVLAAALIFGAAHLNNGPGALPNWRYMILASLAGFIYGKVFQKSGTIFSSVFLHTAVNVVRHTFF